MGEKIEIIDIKADDTIIREYPSDKAGRLDLVEQTNKEIEILNKYMPEQLSEEEVLKVIEEAFNTVNPEKPSDMGKLMGFVTPWVEHPILMTGTAGALIYGIDRFSEACGGDYEKSVLAKAAKFGDNIENSAFFKNKTVKDIIKLF